MKASTSRRISNLVDEVEDRMERAKNYARKGHIVLTLSELERAQLAFGKLWDLAGKRLVPPQNGK